MNKDKLRMRTIFLGGGILGSVLFLLIYGVHVLDVTNEAWLLTGKDITQHYIGWKYFRQSPWHFPFGLLEGLSYPYLTSIVFTDSIPLLAIPFKVLSPVLPKTFQYFGIWGLICYFMNGACGACLVSKFLKSKWKSIVGSVFFILSVPVFQRLYGYLDVRGETRHSSLAALFLIYIALYIWLNREKFQSYKKVAISWSVLAVLATSIQSYYLPIVLGIMCGYLFEELLEKKDWKRIPICFVCVLASTLVEMYLLGVFYGNPNGGAGGYGIYSSNLNSLYNPYGYSSILPDHPVLGGNYEGFAYLGAGVLLMMAIAFVGALILSIRKKRLKTVLKNRWQQILSYGIVVLVFSLLAITNRVEFNDQVLFEIPLSDSLLALLNTVRSSGRFMWPVMCIIILVSLFALTKVYHKQVVTCTLVLCVMIQVFDFKIVMKNTSMSYNVTSDQITKETILVSPEWDIVLKDCTYVDMGMNLEQKALFELVNKAADIGKGVDFFYFSRSYDRYLRSKIARRNKVLQTRKLKDGVLYILTQEEAHELHEYVNVYLIDGIYVATNHDYNQIARC